MKKNVMKKKSNICFDYEPELLLVDINENLLSLQLKKKEQKMKRVTRREKVKACFIFTFTVLSAACILTSVFKSHLFNGELVRGIR